MAAETPCSVLYNDIRSFGGLKHLEIARMLINGNSYLGSTLLEKCSSNRSYLTRYIVHREPDQYAPAIYSDFTVTTPTFPRQSAASSAAASPPIRQSPSTIVVRQPTK